MKYCIHPRRHECRHRVITSYVDSPCLDCRWNAADCPDHFESEKKKE